ncbi:MAG: IS3 family transposase [Eubacteriales bacterium]
MEQREKPDKNADLIAKIAEIQSETRKTYGYRRMKIALEKQGIHRNPKKILRLMRKYNLLSEIRRPRKYRYAKEYLHRYENILNREFSTTRPNEKWGTDISYIHTKQGVLYLSIIRDLYDRSIVSYKTATSQTIQLVLDTIHEAKEKMKVTTEVQLHSDQGFQYTSQAYFNLTQAYNIIPSMSRRGNCLDNAVAENFFGILKTECIYWQKNESFQQANALIDDYIYFLQSASHSNKNEIDTP